MNHDITNTFALGSFKAYLPKKHTPFIYRHALKLIALGVLLILFVGTLVPEEATARQQKPSECMTNAECCQQLGAFTNHADPTLRAFCQSI